jgi:hypothetical protein
MLVSTIAAVAFAQASFAADLTAELNAPDNPNRAPLHAMHAQEAAFNNDWITQVAFAAKAYREDSTVQNEFNLATGLEHTGRIILAIPLYQDVSARGQYVASHVVYDYRKEPYIVGQRVIDSTLGGEATRRLNAIAGRPAPFNP